MTFTDGNGAAVSGERDAHAAEITIFFAIDATAYLVPGTAIPLEQPGLAFAVGVAWCTYCNDVAVTGEGDGAGTAGAVSSRFSIDVAAALNPGTAIPGINARVT